MCTGVYLQSSSDNQNEKLKISLITFLPMRPTKAGKDDTLPSVFTAVHQYTPLSESSTSSMTRNGEPSSGISFTSLYQAMVGWGLPVAIQVSVTAW